jgi:urease accessory protein UreF
MVKRTQLALSDAAEWLGDWHPLAEQLGSADGLVELGSVSSLLETPPVYDPASLKRFLTTYQSRVLLAFELPSIQAAHGHTTKNELRELIALDRQLEHERLLKVVFEPSRRIGQTGLQKLRPLRDERFVQRYLNAVETGEANGWHTFVYGVTLAVYSLPLRQGLLGYAHQTTRGLIYAAACMLQLSEHECRDLFNELALPLPQAVETVLREAENRNGTLRLPLFTPSLGD